MTIYKFGTETRVNVHTADDQWDPSVTALSDGGWVVTWTSNGQGGSDFGVYQQRFDSNGNATSSVDRLVNVTTANSQDGQSVTALANGEWVVTWTSNGQDGSGLGIYQQRFKSNGEPYATPAMDLLVTVTTTGSQDIPSVTTLADGGWVITWRSPGQDGSDDIYQQRFKSNGEPYATPVVDQRVNVTTADHQVAPSITALIDGGWVVTWRSSDGDGGGICQQRFKSNGEPYTTPVVDQRVNVMTAGFQWQQKVTALADGGWVVTWTSPDEDGTSVYQQRFKSNGEPFATPAIDQRVNATTAGTQEEPSVTALADGGWVVTWTSPDGSVTGICQQVFDSNGVAVSEGDLLINVMTAGRQNEPNVTALADGGWVVTWSSRNANGGTDIHQQRFMSSKGPTELTLSVASVQENAAVGTVVGSLSAQDVNLSGGDALTFTLLDNAGGRFTVQGDKLVVANGGLLDYETARSHTITVQVKDKDGLTSERSFAVAIGDVTEIPPGQTLIGTYRANNLVGGAGNDKLYGKLGTDVLIGNGGQDIFVFDTKANTKTNRDTITDYDVAADTLWLSRKVFAKLGKKGSEASPAKLSKAFFKVADKAKDKNDYLVYNKKTGVLSYDRDGSGAAKAVEIAKLTKNLKLTQDDFFIV